jgi:hypothetical protein
MSRGTHLKPLLQKLLLEKSTKVKLQERSQKDSLLLLKERHQQLILNGQKESREAKNIKMIIDRQMAAA